MKVRLLISAAIICVTAGCHKSSPASPSATTTSGETAASPTRTETFNGTLPVGGSSVFNFDVGTYGTVNATLAAIGGTDVESTTEVRMGLGTLGDSGCTTSVASLVQPSTAVAVTTNDEPGTYCVEVQDVGNLFSNASFSLTVAHP